MITIRFLLLWILLIVLSQAVFSQTRVLKFNHTDTPSGSRHISAEFFAKKISDYTQGRYRVLVFHSGQLGNDQDSLAQLSKGQLEFTVSATGTLASQSPNLNLTSLPYLVTDYEHGWRLYDQSPWIAKQFSVLPAKGLRVLSVWEAGFRNFTTKSPLLTPDDAKGKNIRIFNNEMLRWIINSIGYEPVVIPITEVYLALQQGRVDGQENPLDTIFSLRLYEVAPNLSLTQHVYSPLPFVISEQLWQSLSNPDKKAFLLAAKEVSKFSRELVRDNERRLLAAMKERGAIIHLSNQQRFREATQSVYTLAKEKYGFELDELVSDSKRLASP